MTKIQLRRDTSTNWTQNNPIPAQGEPCYETDTGKFKIGNGEQHYNDLHYVGGDSGSAVDAYTKQEVDLKLLDKQDILTPVQPLTIQNKIISNLEGLEYTTDGLGIYTSDKDACAGVFNNNGYTNLGENICLCKQSSYTSTDWSDSVIPSKIIIPYTFGQIVKFPYVGYNNPGFAFWGYNSSVDCYYPIFNPTEEDKISVQTVGTFLNTYGFTFGRTSVARTSLENTRLSIVSNVAYAQLIKNTSTFTLVLFYPTGSNTGNLYRVKYELTNNFSKLNEITSFIITPTTKFNVGGSDYGTSESNPIPISSIGLYEYGGDFSILENPESVLTDNLFDLSGQTAKNYLEVQVDGTTITTNSEGQLQANIPSNITTQGNTFNGASQLVQLDSDGKLPAIDGSQLTNLPSGTAPTNMVTTDTEQTITGTKTFSKYLFAQQPLRVDKINSYQSNANYITYDGSGQGSVTISTPNFCTGKNGSTIINLNTYNNTEYPIINSNNSSTNLMFPGYAWSDVFPNLELVANSDVSQLNMYLDPEVGNNVINVGRNKAADLKISRKPDDSTAAKLYTNLDTGNLQNNIVAGTNITTSVDDDGKVTINATAGGSSEPPANMVTTDTAQNINAVKTFKAYATIPDIRGDGVKCLINWNNNAPQIGHAQCTSITLNANGKTFVYQGSSATIDGKTVATVDDIPDTSSFASQSSVNSINSALNGLKFWKGTETDYTAIETKDSDTLYRTTDTNKVYLGSIALGGSSFVNLTQAQYDELTIKDENTLYIITD